MDDGDDGDIARARLLEDHLAAPALIDLEVVSVWRGLARGGRLDAKRARLALENMRDLPMQRVDHTDLLERYWELRGNLTVYDAAHVVLAEALGCPLLTADAHLSKATDPRCMIEVLRSKG